MGSSRAGGFGGDPGLSPAPCPCVQGEKSCKRKRQGCAAGRGRRCCTGAPEAGPRALSELGGEERERAGSAALHAARGGGWRRRRRRGKGYPARLPGSEIAAAAPEDEQKEPLQLSAGEPRM